MREQGVFWYGGEEAVPDVGALEAVTWVWHTVSDKPCGVCASRDGKVFADEPTDRHPGCRCLVAPSIGLKQFLGRAHLGSDTDFECYYVGVVDEGSSRTFGVTRSRTRSGRVQFSYGPVGGMSATTEGGSSSGATVVDSTAMHNADDDDRGPAAPVHARFRIRTARYRDTWRLSKDGDTVEEFQDVRREEVTFDGYVWDAC